MAGSVLGVFLYMTFHTQSFILALLGIIQILMSFPVAYTLYDPICQVHQFETLSTLIVFVLLGVGADDIFVFTDAWSQSIHYVVDPENHLERMTFTCLVHFLHFLLSN